MGMSSNGYKLLSFESEIFEAPVWQLTDVIAVNEVVKHANIRNVQLISFRAEAEQFGPEKSYALREAGFYKIETLVTLEKEIEKETSQPKSIQFASANDATECAQLAAICFKNDRYHSDENIDNYIADQIKSRWVYNSVSGRADKVFIYRDEKQNILGFNACMYQDAAIIDLIAVHPDHQGKGIGRSLLKAMEQYYADKASIIRLGTQLSNERSLTFYKALNFYEKSRKITWHWSRPRIDKT